MAVWDNGPKQLLDANQKWVDLRDAAKKSWQEFRDDPVWKKAFSESRADGPIVDKVESQFLNPTDYSPLK
jgi:hypothetical protein